MDADADATVAEQRDRAEEKASTDASSDEELSDESENEDDLLDVVLGFAEPKSDADAFAPSKFPSKLGGRPVWLYGEEHLPDAPRCGQCSHVLAFLLQLYAPIDEFRHAFHRMLYVFVCRAVGCSGGQGSVRVFRAQLARKNSFYPYDAEDTDTASVAVHPIQSPSRRRRVECEVCSCASTTQCGQCLGPWYCSRDCQRTDWRLGHKQKCGKGLSEEPLQNGARRRHPWLFKEYEIIDEACPLPSERECDKSQHDNSDDNTKPPSGTLQDVSASELPEAMFRERKKDPLQRREDRAFRRFTEATRLEPSQIIRYWRNGRPLWAAASGQPAQDDQALQNCPHCGSERTFELQIMPQVLYYLGVDGGAGLKSNKGGSGGLDFGVVAVFTCSQSCQGTDGAPESSGRFIEECAFVQKLPS